MSVVFQLACDGSNGSTTFTDSSPSPKTVSVFGNAQVSTAQSKFGGASAAFDGKIARLYNDAQPSKLKLDKRAAGAPNIVLVMLDDVGFGTCSTFGGPVPTPGVDKIAARGLRYNQFHTTALCSPTRASLLTGRNHHSVHMGGIPRSPIVSPPMTALYRRKRRPWPRF